MKISVLLIVTTLAAVTLTSCSFEPSPRPSGREIRLFWEVLDNTRQNSIPCRLTMRNQSAVPLPPEGWSIYFNFLRSPLPETLPAEVRIERVNGDFYRLTPSESFEPLAPGEERAFEFAVNLPFLNRSDAPAGFYVVFNGSQPEELAALEFILPTTDGDIRRGPDDVLPTVTPALRFEQNRSLQLLEPSEIPRIIPTPVALEPRPGTLLLTTSSHISFAPGLSDEASFLSTALGSMLDSDLSHSEEVVHQPSPGVIRLETAPLVVAGGEKEEGAEAYRLEVDPDNGVLIQGSDRNGVFYGIQSLRLWLPVEAYSDPAAEIPVEAVEVLDAPGFGYRGQHLDVARNFHNRSEVERVLDLMALYKLNRFHFHLTDDEGWRLEIPGLPELAEVGSRRGHTESEEDHLVPSFGSGPQAGVLPGSGHYSRGDFIAILRYAHQRHIEVIPEIDLPGHSRAAIKAMEKRYRQFQAAGQTEAASEFRLADPDDSSEYRSVQGWNDNVVNVCQESTYRFVEKVVDELRAMYAEAGVPLTTIHTGGDEVPSGVWAGSPICQSLMAAEEIGNPHDLMYYFLERLSELLSARGLALAGWEEVGLTGGTHDPAAGKGPNPRFADRDFRTYVWNAVAGWGGEELAYRLANAGYEVVLCNVSNLYFDLAYEKHPEEIGYYWGGFVDTRKAWEFTPLNLYQALESDLMGRPIAPERYRDAARLTVEGKDRILGIQGQLWSENAVDSERLQYLLVPKLIGLAERAWAPRPAWAGESRGPERIQAREEAWNRFANGLGQRELARLDRLAGEVSYRIPPPGAAVEDGKLLANVSFPGLAIRYTLDGSEPTVDSTLYSEPVELNGSTARLRTFSSTGRGSRVVTVE